MFFNFLALSGHGVYYFSKKKSLYQQYYTIMHRTFSGIFKIIIETYNLKYITSVFIDVHIFNEWQKKLYLIKSHELSAIFYICQVLLNVQLF